MNEKRQEAISPKDQQVSELDKLQEHGHGAAMEDYLELYLPCWSLDRDPQWRITWSSICCKSLDRES